MGIIWGKETKGGYAPSPVSQSVARHYHGRQGSAICAEIDFAGGLRGARLRLPPDRDVICAVVTLANRTGGW